MARKTLLKRVVSSFTAAALAIVAMPVIPAFAETGVTTYSFDGYDVEYSVKNEWTEGQSIEVKITNTGEEPILNWAFKYNAEGEISDLWNASVYDTKETSYIIKNAGWNYEIAPEASVSFCYTLTDYSGTNPDKFELCAKRVDKTEGFDIQYNIVNEWDTGLQGELVITNTSEEPLEAWELTFDSDLSIENMWNASVLRQEGTYYTIGGGNSSILPGENKNIGFTASKSSELNSISEFTLSSIVIEGLGENGAKSNNNTEGENADDNNNTSEGGSEQENSHISDERYPYTLFAGSSEEGAITISADNFCINGDIATNGTIETTIDINVNGIIKEKSDEEMIYIFNKIDNLLYEDDFDEHENDYDKNENNIIIDVPTEVGGKVIFSGNVNVNSTLKAIETISFIGEVENINNSIIFSKYGDVSIEGQTINVNGIIYAPFGKVCLNAQNINLNNAAIIADTIVFNATNINVNRNERASNFIGNASEELNIPITEYQYLTDSDNDLIPDVIEDILGTDPYNIDTDGDFLSDGYELFETFTDPLQIDTDNNGILDGSEDFDDDGLNNIEEFEKSTHPFISDSDGDGLIDGEEVDIWGTDPLSVDTDADGLEDGDEIEFGTNPLSPYSGADSISDGDRKRKQTYSFIVENEECAVNEILVDINATGNVNKTMSVESLMNIDLLSTNVVGLIGEPFDINCSSDFDEATIIFRVDKNRLGKTKFEDLVFLWHDEREHIYRELPTEYDPDNCVVSTKVNHFSKYMIVDKNLWYEAWSVDLYGTEETATVNKNTVLVIDCSGSMSSNDRMVNNTCGRIDAAKGFINSAWENDYIAIIAEDSRAKELCAFTNDKGKLISSLSKIYSSGGNNFDSSLTMAMNYLNDMSNGNSSNIIFMSDGGCSVSQSTLTRLRESNINVVTIGYGNYSYDSILKQIASNEDNFYKAISAKELIEIYSKLGTKKEFDKTDNDNDGLPDVFEIAGMRLENGRVIYTDPLNDDSDYDNFKDGEEIVPEYRYMSGFGIPSDVLEGTKAVYFLQLSDPNKSEEWNKDYGLVEYDGYYYHIDLPITNPKGQYYIDGDWTVIKELEFSDFEFDWVSIVPSLQLHNQKRDALYAGKTQTRLQEYSPFKQSIPSELMSEKLPIYRKNDIHKKGVVYESKLLAPYFVAQLVLDFVNAASQVRTDYYIKYTFMEYSKARKVVISIGNSDINKIYREYADGQVRSAYAANYNTPQGVAISKAVRELYTEITGNKTDDNDVYDFLITVDKEHGRSQFSSYLWIDNDGNIVERNIIYPNDRVVIGKRCGILNLGFTPLLEIELKEDDYCIDEYFQKIFNQYIVERRK